MIPSLAYWQAVAQGIDAEDQKLRVFVRHNLSLGLARETILRSLIINQTPEPYKVRTGFICDFSEPDPWLSRQCDVLVYDPQEAQPYYNHEAFCVVPRNAARLVVEVKTDLDQKSLPEIARVAEDARGVPVPTLGFAFDGWTFDKAVKDFAEVIGKTPRAAPDCIAVHARNYVIFRPQTYNEDSVPYTGFDFSGLEVKGAGLATAILLRLCDLWVGNRKRPWEPPQFFGSLEAGKVKAAKISPAGVVGPYSF